MEIERALEEIAKDPARIQVWQFVLSKYNPTFIGQCEQAVEWAREFVRTSLAGNMFSDRADRDEIADRVVGALEDVRRNKSHSRHIHIDDCIEMGLNIVSLEDDQSLQDAVLTVHHCFMHSLNVSGAGKIVENHKGAAFMKVGTAL